MMSKTIAAYMADMASVVDDPQTYIFTFLCGDEFFPLGQAVVNF
jgi:hypothetical protein